MNFMNEALKEAKKAYDIKEVPVGAVIVKDGKIIARGYNKKEKNSLALEHAEIIAIKKASKKLENWRLTGCEMYVTLEPCPMCAGAIMQSRISKLHIASKDTVSGASGTVIDITNSKELNYKLDVEFGELEEESSKLLKTFFKELRK